MKRKERSAAGNQRQRQKWYQECIEYLNDTDSLKYYKPATKFYTIDMK